MIVLAGDIGGTNTRLALADVEARGLKILREERYPSRDYPGLEPVVRRFLSGSRKKPARACYGIAGPIVDQRVRTPNLPWTIDRADLARETGIKATHLINDFTAVGHGIGRLGPEDLVTLQAGAPVPRGPIALVGAGTGLGVGFLVWDGTRHRVQGSEGGHRAFAAQNELEWGLASFLRAEHGHVSYERVLSGSGLAAIYRYLARAGQAAEQPAVREEMAKEDPAAVVTRRGLDRSDALCARALDVFVAVYGQYAGQLAITLLASGGLYVAGGIAPRIVPRLAEGAFVAAFRDQGRLSSFAATIPVHVVVSTDVGLWGAAAAAWEGESA